MSQGGINDTMNTIVYGQLQLNINGSSINFPKAYVGPKSISLAVPASHALTGHGGFQAICYITPNVDGNNIKLKHGWSETGPYCSIDVDGAMYDESTVARIFRISNNEHIYNANFEYESKWNHSINW